MYYREYRPKSYSELIGINDIVSILTTGVLNKDIPHAYFFAGNRGTGKTTTARIFAKSVNCDNLIKKQKDKRQIIEPCNKCNICNSIDNSSFPDLVELDGASYRGIDTIREITDTVKLTPSIGKAKVYIIDEVHMLTTEAANALLKTLEEPPSHVYFILCTTNPEKVLPTIKSRCIQVRFNTPSIVHIIEKLKRIATDKGFDITDDDLSKIAIKSNGAYRDAETYLEQYFSLGNTDKNNLFYNDSESFEMFVRLYKAGEITSLIKLVNDVYEKGVDLEEWTKSFLGYLRSLLLYKIKATQVVTTYNFSEDLASDLSLEELSMLMNQIKKTLTEFKNSIVPVFPLELCIVDLFLSKTENLTKVKTIELKIDNVVSTIKKDQDKLKKEKKKPKNTMSDNEKAGFYKKLLTALKENNNSIYLILSSCVFDSFDGESLNLLANYSFHKERILSAKTRLSIEKIAAEIIGGPVKLNCDLITPDEKAKRLTDKNVTSVKNSKALEEVFDEVFGEDIEKNPAQK